jgi:AcrR family transcriptional regulator
MAEPASAVSAAAAPKASRLDRRKARTRQALIDAAVQLIGDGRGDRASVQEITDAADIGFGSFYNHFDSKEQLFQTASEEVMERWGQMIDRASAGITDHAERFAVGMRISGRLGWTHPDIAGFLIGAGLGALDIPVGLAPRALRDIQAGQAAARFTIPDAEIALSSVAGGLLGLLQQCQRKPDRVTEASVDQLTEALLRMLGVPASEAASLVALPLPPTGTWLHPAEARACPLSGDIASWGNSHRRSSIPWQNR